MRITDVKSRSVLIPLKDPIPTSFGVSKASLATIIKVHTDEDIIGIGSVGPVPTTARTQAIINHEIKPRIIGEDPFNVEKIVHSYLTSFPIRWALESSIYVIGGIEIALWDIIGKHLKIPIYKLLGGLCREKVPITAFLGMKEPDAVAKDAIDAVEFGFKTVKLKVGRKSKESTEIVKAVRDAVGNDIEIRIDPNQAWSVPQAIRLINKIARYDPQYIEQPIFRWDIDGLARVRKSVSVPIALCEASVSIYPIMEAIRKEAVDYISTDPLRVGGFHQLKRVCGIAEASDVPVVLHVAEPGIATAAWAHFAASTPSIEHAMDTILTEGVGLVAVDDVITKPFKCVDGSIQVPKGLGLGVEVDSDKVAKYATKVQTYF